MKLLEMIASFRLKANDYNSTALSVVSWLKQADRQLFIENGGISNPEIAHALQETVSDIVSESRSVIVLPNDAASPPRAVFNGKVCHAIDKTTALTIDQHPRLKPAFVYETRRATFYWDAEYRPPNEINSGVYRVHVSYTRNPRPILHLGGFDGLVEAGGFGIKGKSNLRTLRIIWPVERPSYATNELSGSFVSLQTSRDERMDYRIEEHESGELSKLWVNPNAEVIPFVDMNFLQSAPHKGFRATIHRSSELPDSYHQLIVDRAVMLMNHGVEVKK